MNPSGLFPCSRCGEETYGEILDKNPDQVCDDCQEELDLMEYENE